MSSSPSQMKKSVLFVTGLSGAGISSTMKILEDMGFLAFDNLPLSLVMPLLEQEESVNTPIAISVDTRTPHFDPVRLMDLVGTLSSVETYQVKTFFLTAEDSVLLKRYNETRRTHPMAKDRPIVDGIAAEKSLLFPLKHQASSVIDSSDFSIHDLRRVVQGFASGFLERQLNISLMSFSYRHGLPREADLVFDVRFLRNPNWETSLKDLTGLDAEVQRYVQNDPAYSGFSESLQLLLERILPRYLDEGKSYLTIAFGCTGGRHRSVSVCEEMAAFFRRKNLPVHIHHREIKNL